MNIDFPQIDQILHASFEKDAYSQREYVNMMNKCNNFLNLTFAKEIDRISRTYNNASIADILSSVNSVLEEENNSCPNQIVYDDFVKNADLVSLSLKKIVNNPSRKLIKINKNVPADKVTAFDSKTMCWLARRPGITISEKIAPKNLIPTKVTYFTADTVENRHAMYLYDILYDYLYEKIYSNGHESKCDTCPFKDKKCYILYDKLRSLLFLKHKIMSSDLRDVLKQKQLRQNNKLLSDKEYKQIWDAVVEIDFYERNCKNVWNNLLQRYQFISFLIICARISLLENIDIFDDYYEIVENSGKMVLINNDGCNVIKFYDKDKNNEIILSLNDNHIDMIINNYYSNNSVSFNKKEIYKESFDLSNIFDEFNLIKENEDKFKAIREEVTIMKKDLADLQGKIDEMPIRQEQIKKFASFLIQKVVSDNVKEEQKE